IAANGYNFLYLTSRSVGQADMTRAYLKGVVQDGGYKLPGGPVILSPDRTIAALRREVYLRKPEIFKMACLRDVMALFTGHGGATNVHESQEAGLHPFPVNTVPTAAANANANPGSGSSPAANQRKPGTSPFYAGFGNRLTDALSYRSVNIPSTRIFTINSNSEVSLDLLSLNTYKTAYGGMREIVDHYFPPVGLLVKGGGEEFTDFNFWRSRPLDIGDFSGSESGEEDEVGVGVLGAPMTAMQRAKGAAGLERTETVASLKESLMSEDEGGDELLESYLSEGARGSLDESLQGSLMGEEEEDDGDDELDDGDDELDGEEEGEDEDEAATGFGPVTPELSKLRRLALDDQAEDTPRAACEKGGAGLGLSGV
ncbi:hypothetical protein B0A55_12181, partial [Friedmanniomyces simplex]